MQSSLARTEPATEAIAADLYALITYAHQSCTPDLFEALGTLELSLTQMKLLHHLTALDDERTVKQIAEHLRLSLPAASRSVDDLVRRGLAERREDPEDRRMKRVRVAEPGRAVVRKLNATRLDNLTRFAATLDDTEREAVAEALTALLHRPEIAACRPEGSNR